MLVCGRISNGSLFDIQCIPQFFTLYSEQKFKFSAVDFTRIMDEIYSKTDTAHGFHLLWFVQDDFTELCLEQSNITVIKI